MNSKKVETWHGIIITHIACAKKLRGLQQKLDALRVQTEPSPTKYEGSNENSSIYKGISFFYLF